MVITAALVSAVLIVDDATSAPPGSAAPPVAPTAEPVTTAPATPLDPSATPVDPSDPPLPHRDARGVIQTTGMPAKTVALTFDDGPSSTHTPRVLDILDKHHVKATFCVVGTNATAHPDLLRDIVAHGHALCDHTATHDLHLPDRDDARIDAEIGGALAAIRAAAPGVEVPFYRAPGGNFAQNVVTVAAGYELAPLGWSIDPRDWTEPGAAVIRTAVIDGVVPGSIVLLHDGGGDQSGTVDALEGIITALRDAGYEFVIPTM
jgi:peptidoglycan-N-acetylglucosamine deacetylase